MAYQQRPMSGSLFKNDRKQNENHPDYSGTAEIDGKLYWISGWLKKSQRGDFFSAFKPKDAGGEFKQMRQAAGPAPRTPAAAAPLPKEDDSSLPF